MIMLMVLSGLCLLASILALIFHFVYGWPAFVASCFIAAATTLNLIASIIRLKRNKNSK